MKRIAILFLVIATPVYGQIALTPHYDSAAVNAQITSADRAKAKRFQKEPWVTRKAYVPGPYGDMPGKWGTK